MNGASCRSHSQSWFKPLISLAGLFAFTWCACGVQPVAGDEQKVAPESSKSIPSKSNRAPGQDNRGDRISGSIAVAGAVSQQVASQEWLGPLAGVALSPFFGIACLSGIATYGPEWLQERSAWIGPSSPLRNPTLFWTMAVLTILTSVPRLTKVSKPLALMVEKLEAYSAVIILIAFRFAGVYEEPIDLAYGNVPSVMLAGMPPSSFALAMSIAALVNVIVINTVKLAIELLVWLIPFPFLDALLELFNKSLCAAWMALYAFSPLLATALNLILFLMCAMVFMRVRRRYKYYRELLLKPLLYRMAGWVKPDATHCLGFLTERWKGCAKLTPLQLSLQPDGSCRIELRSLWQRGTWQGRWRLSETQRSLIGTSILISLDGTSLHCHVRRDVPLGLHPTLATNPA